MNEKCLNDQTTQADVSTIQSLNSDVVVEVGKLNTINEEIPAITCEMKLPSAEEYAQLDADYQRQYFDWSIRRWS